MATDPCKDISAMTIGQPGLPTELLVEIFSHVTKGWDLMAIGRACWKFALIVESIRFRKLQCQSPLHIKAFVSRIIENASLGRHTRDVDMRNMPSLSAFEAARLDIDTGHGSAYSFSFFPEHQLQRAATSLQKFVTTSTSNENWSLENWQQEILDRNPDAIMAFVLLNMPQLHSLRLSLNVLYGWSPAPSLVDSIFITLCEQQLFPQSELLNFKFAQLRTLSVSGQGLMSHTDGAHFEVRFCGGEEVLAKFFAIPTLRKLSLSSFFIEDRPDQLDYWMSLKEKFSSVTDLEIDDFECSSTTLARLIKAPRQLERLHVRIPENPEFIDAFEARDLTRAIMAHRDSLTHLHFELSDCVFPEDSNGNLDGFYSKLPRCKRLQELTIIFPTPTMAHNPLILLDMIPSTTQVLHLTNPAAEIYEEHGKALGLLIENRDSYPSLVKISARLRKRVRPKKPPMMEKGWDPEKLKLKMYW